MPAAAPSFMSSCLASLASDRLPKTANLLMSSHPWHPVCRTTSHIPSI
jgi:hypothetical protein